MVYVLYTNVHNYIWNDDLQISRIVGVLIRDYVTIIAFDWFIIYVKF